MVKTLTIIIYYIHTRYYINLFSKHHKWRFLYSNSENLWTARFQDFTFIHDNARLLVHLVLQAIDLNADFDPLFPVRFDLELAACFYVLLIRRFPYDRWIIIISWKSRPWGTHPNLRPSGFVIHTIIYILNTHKLM